MTSPRPPRPVVAVAALGLTGLGAGVLAWLGWRASLNSFGVDALLGLGSGLVGAAATFLVVERAFEGRVRLAESRAAEAEETRQRRELEIEQALRIVRSPGPEVVRVALATLAELGALDRLRGRYLSHACFDGLDLRGLDLTGTRLFGTTFRGAQLDDVVLAGATVRGSALAVARSLRGATMRDGTIYDGRLRLAGDLEAAAEEHDLTDPQQMAAFYRCSEEDYRRGQAWASQNLQRFLGLASELGGSRRWWEKPRAGADANS